MRALVNRKAGGPDVLTVEERADLSPAPSEVRVRVKRAGLNFADISARVGLYPDAPKFPMVMGYEVSGIVDGVGSGVTTLRDGDRVTALCRFGGQASMVCVPAAQVRRMPDAMSFDEGAALPVNYLTAYQMLFWTAPLLPGMSVLVHMAAGGVGQAAIQLCKTVPNVTIYGTASAGKHEFLRQSGVHHPIDYRTQDYAAEVMRLTKGRGVDRILDALGGKDWERGLSALRSGGTLFAFGWANMIDGETRSLLHVAKQFLSMKKWSPMELMGLNKGIIGINLGHLWHEVELIGSHLEALLRLYEQGAIKPHVDRVFPLSKAGEAHAHVQARKNVGKVVFDCEA
ncbi:MAG: medium chain dehydrogenase/reductase family protein [Myxococcaceae bacterium]|jgi:NADPH:quinone reductase-like Zn-dependent oxidoreductase|nr:medium chain dehydrogenase/reductase family protein [Myxococcaceae bacterium]